ncbi:MAG: ArsC family reductase [Pseudomonadota bacterium]
MITLYGIPNCDTVRKARQWLAQQNIDYQFHDFREAGLELATLEQWFDSLGWESVINRRSTSWKQLSPERRDGMNAEAAAAAAVEHPTLVKRPVLDTGKSLHLGFTPAAYQDIFNQRTL